MHRRCTGHFIVSPHFLSSLSVAAVVLMAVPAQAQETSRQIPFALIADASVAPGTYNARAQLWDDPIAGTLLFDELEPGVTVDADGNFSFVWGSQTPTGLDPTSFPSGTSRWLDVVDDMTSASILPGGARIPLNATAFALSPGPQ